MIILESTTMSTQIPDTAARNMTALGNFYGNISNEFINKISPHWLQFQPQPPSVHHSMALIYFFMMVFGIFGNFIVVYIHIRCPSVRTPSNNLIMNLAVSDFLIMLEAPIFIYNSLHFGPASGELGCKLYGLLGGAGGTVAIMSLCAISIDRYNVIVFPMKPSRSTTRKASLLIIAIIWCYSFPFFITPVLEIDGITGYTPEGFLTACSFDYLDTRPTNVWFILSYAVAAYFFPLLIIAFCYFHILRVVIITKKIQSSKEKYKTELKLAGIVFGIISLWLLAWTPYCIVALVGISGHGHLITPLASMIPAVMAKLSACCNPYLYAMSHPRYRIEIQRLFCSSQDISSFPSQMNSLPRSKSKCKIMTIKVEPSQHIPLEGISIILIAEEHESDRLSSEQYV